MLVESGKGTGESRFSGKGITKRFGAQTSESRKAAQKAAKKPVAAAK